MKCFPGTEHNLSKVTFRTLCIFVCKLNISVFIHAISAKQCEMDMSLKCVRFIC